MRPHRARAHRGALGDAETLAGGTRGAPRTQGVVAAKKKVFALSKTLESAGVVHSGEVRSLRAFVQRQTGLSALEFCDVQACSTLIESLKAWAKRSGVALKG